MINAIYSIYYCGCTVSVVFNQNFILKKSSNILPLEVHCSFISETLKVFIKEALAHLCVSAPFSRIEATYYTAG